MKQYVIKGGTPLVGEVVIGGAKNSALGILAAAVMTDGECHIDNLPNVSDINVLLQAMEQIGATVDRIGPHEVVISGKTIDGDGDLIVDNEFIRKIRASYYFIGALLGKYKKAHVALPGGCAIGARPIDQHIKGFEALGATVEISGGMIHVVAEELIGKHIFMDVVSVGATINVMMAAAMAKGNTIIENAAKEPHVVDAANFLNSMGANIKGAGTDVIRIKGVEKFHNTTYSIIPDQIEAGTFMTAAATTKGDIIIRNVIPRHLEPISQKLQEMGAVVESADDAVRVIASGRLKPTQIKTLPYPGFPTDMQPQMAAAMALSDGTSVIRETIFENRFLYVDELNKMGAQITTEGTQKAVIQGVEGYKGADVVAPDLRAGAALVIAGLAADGYTTVSDIKYILRGYEQFDEKLRNLGGCIELVETEEEAEAFKQRTR
ncbi:MAG: UDP-N-acetylglucosamine 1-carboxyvinyltransferase [Lachnospiraceae bacterium]|nr:UDP-N-acetylglucosamine 1-carboxyvinyltransferase [Lachnospiraceae bacterium]